jgi:hypothetical protein
MRVVHGDLYASVEFRGSSTNELSSIWGAGDVAVESLSARGGNCQLHVLHVEGVVIV